MFFSSIKDAMKMDGELPNGEAPGVPSAVDIGREFVRQYYTMLSEHPEDAFRFYGHESVFNHNDVVATGQQKIQKAIEDLAFHDSKVRIYSIKGSSTIAGGIVLQVAGEMTLRGSPTRRFAQTFVLGQQTAKKFYVHNDVFTYHDKVFETAESISPTPAISNYAKLNGPVSKPALNGHRHIDEFEQRMEEVATHVKVLSTESVKKDESPLKASTHSPSPAAPPSEPRTQPPPSVTVPSPRFDTHTEQVVPVPPVDNTPKTWAKLVGGARNASSAPAPPQPIAPPKPQPQTQSAPVVNTAPAGNSSVSPAAQRGPRNASASGGHFEQGIKKLFVSNIPRNKVPEDLRAVESDFRREFSKFGEVEFVSIPRRFLDPSEENRTMFGFVTMRNVADAQTALKATREERGQRVLHISVMSVGYEGDVNVSEQRERGQGGPPGTGGGFRGGRGGGGYGGGGRGGGGFGGPRGGGRGTGRGGFRGGHQQSPASQQH